jgi:murein DD-endopeptidase MepM/ murein hydrolase activator NlpD
VQTPAAQTGWAWPLPGIPPSSISSPFCGRWGSHHDGIDIAAPRGRDIGATRTGRVLHAGFNNGGYGYLVILGHGAISGYGRVHSYYAHMAGQPTVRVGQTVNQLQRLGEVDSTGHSTGNHLHFEIRKNAASGAPFTGTPVNPCAFLGAC